MKRITTKIGDVFEVKIDGNFKKYFQYIANDMSQLNSSVIRAFKKKYLIADNPDLTEIIADDVDFYAHTVLRRGIEMGLWQHIGKIPEVGTVDVFFRDSADYGTPSLKVSFDWWIWKINQPFIHIGKLEGNYQKAEIGVVINAKGIVARLQTGEYHFFYPKYE